MMISRIRLTIDTGIIITLSVFNEVASMTNQNGENHVFAGCNSMLDVVRADAR